MNLSPTLNIILSSPLVTTKSPLPVSLSQPPISITSNSRNLKTPPTSLSLTGRSLVKKKTSKRNKNSPTLIKKTHLSRREEQEVSVEMLKVKQDSVQPTNPLLPMVFLSL